MLLLLLSLILLGLGPALYGLARRQTAMLAVLDGFVLVAITGLVLVHLLPDNVEAGGWWALLFAVVGLLLPTALEHLFHRSVERTHVVTMVVVLIGLGLHAMADGTALAPAGHADRLLPYAVLLHRFPVGLTLWWLLRPGFGVRPASAALGLIGLSTVAGFFLGPGLIERMSPQAAAWFQAFVAGSLLHVVLHQRPLDERVDEGSSSPRLRRRLEGVGALIALGSLTLIGDVHEVPHGAQAAEAFLGLALETAPALVLAYVMAGLVQAFLPDSSVQWMGRGGPFGQAARGMALGLPVPVCSCGVVPLYRSLIRRGVPATSAMAFLVATPELGLDAVLVSFPLLGVEMALIRIGAAALVALLVGWIVGRIAGEPRVPVEAGESVTLAATVEPLARLRAGLRVGLGEVVDHTAPWILLGLAVAAVVRPVVSGGWLAGIPAGADVLVFALLGLPTYVCASGATPLVAVLLVGGISPGAALAFLLTGPATNVTTLGVLARLHGRRIALAFGSFMIATTVALGYLVNGFLPGAGAGALIETSSETASPLQWVSLAALALIFLASLLRVGARGFLNSFLPEPHAGHTPQHAEG